MEQQNVTLRFTADAGWVIHKPSTDPSKGASINGVYRYGPCLITDEKGGIGMYTASPGNAYAEWDWGRYRYSPDGGKSWDDEVVAVKPTPGQMDAVSTCDPGVFKMGEYYYAGYTSTYEAGGVNNMVFIGRSKNPQGPFNEKWTGSGWSLYESRPAMIYDGNPKSFGVGEPSFVVKDGTVYMYYNWWDRAPDGSEIAQTRVALAEADNENWPATLKEYGVAFEKKHGAEDSSDIKYVEEYDKWIAVNTAHRFADDSFIAVYESDDGLTFAPSTVIRGNIAKFCHNMGISGDAQGHIKKGAPIYIAYAYSTAADSWANWYTRMHKVTMKAVPKDTEDAELSKPNMLKPGTENDLRGGKAIETLHSREPVLYVDKDAEATLKLYIIHNDYSEEDVTGSNLLTYEIQDPNILSVTANGKIRPLKTGSSYIKATHSGNESAYALIKVCVIDTPFTRVTASGTAENLENLQNGGTFDTARISAGGAESWFGVMGPRSEVRGVAIFPKYQGYGWPSSFSVEYCDGRFWKTVPGMENLSAAVNMSSSVTPLVYRFEQPVQCEGMRVVNNDRSIAFEMSELFVLEGDMADLQLSTIRDEYVLDANKTFAQIMVEAVWKFGFRQEYYGTEDGVTYAVADPSIVRIDETGMAFPLKEGTTTVMMTLFGEEVSCKVTVK